LAKKTAKSTRSDPKWAVFTIWVFAVFAVFAHKIAHFLHKPEKTAENRPKMGRLRALQQAKV